MKVSLPNLKRKRGENEKDAASLLAEWIGPGVSKEQAGNGDLEGKREPDFVDNRPIEPEAVRSKGPSIAKWIIFILFIGYVVISYYHVPILTALGDYLIVEHPVKKADLIVCTPGSPLEQSLMAADLYKRGLSPRIFIPEEVPPDGLNVLKERGGHYPEASELFSTTLKSLSVPVSACTVGQLPVDSIQEAAAEVRKLVMSKGYTSMIIVTPPYSARSTYLIFKKVFDGEKLEMMISPSRYTNFKADNWWKRNKYLKEVIFECQKLLYYTIKGL